MIAGGRDPQAARAAPAKRGRGDRSRSGGPRPNLSAPPRQPAPVPRRPRGPARPPASEQPDPMKTTQGYIGADSFRRPRAPGAAKPGGGRRGGASGGRRGG